MNCDDTTSEKKESKCYREFEESPTSFGWVSGDQGRETLPPELRRLIFLIALKDNNACHSRRRGPPSSGEGHSKRNGGALSRRPGALAKLLPSVAQESPVSFKAACRRQPSTSRPFESLSNLPSKEELISKVMFVINSSAQRLAVVTAGVARNLTIVIDQVRAQKESQG